MRELERDDFEHEGEDPSDHDGVDFELELLQVVVEIVYFKVD